MKARVAVILLNWNGWQDTVECLESLLHLSHTSFAIVVVDNASTDGSMENINEWCVPRVGKSLGFNSLKLLTQGELPKVQRTLQHRDVVLVQSESNGGFASGNNLGLRLALLAGCERMWLLNNDTTVDPQALSALEERMSDEPSFGMLGSVLHYYDQPQIIQAVGGVKFNFWRARGRQVGQGLRADAPEVAALGELNLTYVAGASMLVSREFVEDVGLMEEGYFLYFEEIDWACRAADRWRAGTAVHSRVFHKEGASIGTASRSHRSELSQYYLTRNLILFYRYHRPSLVFMALLGVSYEAAKLLLLGKGSLFSCMWSAAVDGARGCSGMRRA